MQGKNGLKRFLMAFVCLFNSQAIFAAEFKLDHVVVSYDGISEDYAKAIGKIVETARNSAVEKFGFDMPNVINVKANLDPTGKVQLFNDGADMISLTVRSDDNLKKPSSSGTFNIYGFCHEVGHLAMYRLIRDHSWLTSAAAEGWAPPLGSRLTDIVYEKEGQDLWPDRYDYREDGMKRLEKQLSADKPSATAKGAAAWKQLVGILGDKNIAPIFKALGQAKFDPTDPGEEAGKILIANSSDQTEQWWNDVQELFILKREKSKVKADKIEEDKLSAKVHKLAQDDDKAVGQQSLAGGGHAVRFKAQNGSCYLTEVQIYGARYGMPAPPKENFHVWLCDKDFKVIADNQFPYSKFTRGNPKWVPLKIKPTQVPEEFIVCVGFNPTATKGVFVYFDADGSGNSLVGLPGEESETFEKGDWMIRATVTEKGE